MTPNKLAQIIRDTADPAAWIDDDECVRDGAKWLIVDGEINLTAMAAAITAAVAASDGAHLPENRCR